MSYLLIGLSGVLVTVFGVSTWSKIADQNAFVASLRPMPLLPGRFVRPVAAAVTVTELAVALGVGWYMVAVISGAPGQVLGVLALALAGLLLAVLTAGIVIALRRGADAKCACFGASEQPLSGRHIVRNSVLLGVVVAALVLQTLIDAGSAEVAGAVIGLGSGLIVALVLIRLDDLVELFAPVPASRPRS